MCFEEVGCFAGEGTCVIVGGCFEKRCEYCFKGVSYFDGGGRLCFHVVLIRVDNTVCTYEMVILFAWIHYGGNN